MRVDWEVGRSLLLWLPLVPIFCDLPEGGRFSPLLAATLKFDSKRTKSRRFHRQNVKLG